MESASGAARSACLAARPPERRRGSIDCSGRMLMGASCSVSMISIGGLIRTRSLNRDRMVVFTPSKDDYGKDGSIGALGRICRQKSRMLEGGCFHQRGGEGSRGGQIRHSINDWEDPATRPANRVPSAGATHRAKTALNRAPEPWQIATDPPGEVGSRAHRQGLERGCLSP